MNRNEFLKNLGFGVSYIFISESLLSSCKMNVDMAPSTQTILDGEFKNSLRIPDTILLGTDPLIAQ